MREPERPDLSPLDPRGEPERWERMVRQIMALSITELKRRQAAGVFGLFDGLLAWSRPALATAAALAGLSLFALSRVDGPETVANTPPVMWPSTMAEEVRVWLEQGQPPSMLDLIVLKNGEN